MAWQIDELKTQNSFGTKTNSTGDLNLTGVAILSYNLALAVTGNTNKQDLQDSYYSESMSLGISTSMNFGGNGNNSNSNQSTIIGTGGQPNTAPGGSNKHFRKLLTK